MNKTLIILAEYYPYAAGEFFLDDELRVISKYFERICVFVNKKPLNNPNRAVPDNAIIISYEDKPGMIDKLYACRLLVSKFTKEEFHVVLSNYKLPLSWRLFKIIFMELVRSQQIKSMLSNYLREQQIGMSETVFYSYWHDYKALGIALMKEQSPSMKCIARAHGWDVFAVRHSFPYLPYKTFTIRNLDVTFSISEAGKSELLNRTQGALNNKIQVSRLGKSNLRQALFKKEMPGYVCCSCSNIISLKRLHIIIQILRQIDLRPLQWIHFGDGPLKAEMMQMAAEEIPGVQHEFRGLVSNQEILDFYSNQYVDIFLNVSESEGIPVSIMEAFSAAIPVLATNVGGNAEIVNDQNGFLIPADVDVKEAAHIIQTFLLTPPEIQKKYRQNAYETWNNNYNANVNYSAFAKYLQQL